MACAKDDGDEERTGGRASSRRLLQILAGAHASVTPLSRQNLHTADGTIACRPRVHGRRHCMMDTRAQMIVLLNCRRVSAASGEVVRNEPMVVDVNFGTVRLGTMECERKEATTDAALRECFGVGTDREPGMTDEQQTRAANEVVEGDREEEEGREGKDVPAAMLFPPTSCTSPAAVCAAIPVISLQSSNGRIGTIER